MSLFYLLMYKLLFWMGNTLLLDKRGVRFRSPACLIQIYIHKLFHRTRSVMNDLDLSPYVANVGQAVHERLLLFSELWSINSEVLLYTNLHKHTHTHNMAPRTRMWY